MLRALPRLTSILFASAAALAASTSGLALAQPSPGPVPVPYPLTNEAVAAEPSPATEAVGRGPILCIPIKLCLPKAAGTLQLEASQGENAGSGGGKDIEVLAWGWGAVDLPPAGSADPQEGGEVVGGVDDRATAEAAARKRRPSRETIGEVVTKRPDKSSPILLSKPTETPPPSGMVTLLVPAGTCVQGARYPAVTLRSEGKAYELQDVTVAECGPAVAAKGKKAQTQKLQYLKVEMKEIFVSG